MAKYESLDPTECFYWCDPNRADTCRKQTCHIHGGSCYLTMRPDWGYEKVSTDATRQRRREIAKTCDYEE